MGSTAQSKPLRGTGKGSGATFIAVSLIGIVTLRYTYLLFLIGMLPSLVAYAIDRMPERYYFKIMAGFNLAGVAPVVAGMWQGGSSSSLFAEYMHDYSSWLIMYGAAAVGWGLFLFFPSVVYTVIQGMCKGKVMEIEEQQQKLLEEWGSDLRRDEGG